MEFIRYTDIIYILHNCGGYGLRRSRLKVLNPMKLRKYDNITDCVTIQNNTASNRTLL